MAEILFSLLLVVHGLIHLLGFIKAFGMAPVELLKKDYSKPEGVLWLLSTTLFFCTAILFFLDHPSWQWFGSISIVLSQVLIIASWKEAKFGTLPNSIILIAILLAFQYPNSAPEDIRSYNAREFISHLENRVPAEMEHLDVPGAVILLINNEKVIWQKAFGYADLENRVPMTTEATVMAHSISKSVTAWGVMKLIEQGSLNPEEPVIDYIGDWSFPESDYPVKDVTARRLLSNSAGIPLGTLGKHYAPDDALPPLRNSLSEDDIRLIAAPGTRFIYSNSGYAVLELLTEEITGQNFAAYMQDEVLLPLGMNNSAFAWQDSMQSKIPMGYDLHGNPVQAYLYPYRASGGLFTTLGDIGRFVIAGMHQNGNDEKRSSSNRVLTAEGISEMYRPEIELGGMFGLVSDAYGFGHFIETLPNKQKAVWHGGQGMGWMTHFHSVPEEGAGIVIITNSQRSWPLMAEILKDWSLWEGFGPVKFSRISIASFFLNILITILVLFALWKASNIASGIIRQQRKPMRKSGIAPGRQLTDFAGWAFITSVLIWAVTSDYLFITSIFPAGAVWLGRTLLLLSIVLLVSALIPYTEKEKTGIKEASL